MISIRMGQEELWLVLGHTGILKNLVMGRVGQVGKGGR
jgi:hypothetical protein